jgi:hypothetical protein
MLGRLCPTHNTRSFCNKAPRRAPRMRLGTASCRRARRLTVQTVRCLISCRTNSAPMDGLRATPLGSRFSQGSSSLHARDPGYLQQHTKWLHPSCHPRREFGRCSRKRIPSDWYFQGDSDDRWDNMCAGWPGHSHRRDLRRFRQAYGRRLRGRMYWGSRGDRPLIIDETSEEASAVASGSGMCHSQR